MQSTSLRRRFLRLTIPNILSNITVPLVGLVDTAMLGHVDEIRFLAGVALAAILFEFVYWTFGFLRMSTTGMTAQAVGRDEQNALYMVLYRSLFLALVFAALILILQKAIAAAGFGLLSGTNEVEAAGRDYFFARIWDAPATLCNFVFLGWFLGREKSDYALGMSVILLLAPGPFYQLLTSHTDIIALVRQYDIYVIIVLIFGAPAYIYDGFFIGLLQGRTLRNSMLISSLLLFLPVGLGKPCFAAEDGNRRF